MTIRPNGWARCGLSLYVVLFTALWLTILGRLALRGFWFAGFVALWGLAVGAGALLAALGTRMDLEHDGFRVRGLLFDRGAYFRWAETGPFVVGRHGAISTVMFNGTPHSMGALWGLALRWRSLYERRYGYSNILWPRAYGRSALALAGLLNEWREQQPSS